MNCNPLQAGQLGARVVAWMGYALWSEKQRVRQIA